VLVGFVLVFVAGELGGVSGAGGGGLSQPRHNKPNESGMSERASMAERRPTLGRASRLARQSSSTSVSVSTFVPSG
jgi:hypothetical protein